MFCKICKENKRINNFKLEDRNKKDYSSVCSYCEIENKETILKKMCSQCNEEKTTFEFDVDRNKKHGFRSKCKTCQAKNRKNLINLKLTSPDQFVENKFIRDRVESNLRRYKRMGIEITIEEYLDILNKAESKCDICKADLTNKQANLDHCHETKKVRGILCSNCNIMLGQAKDSVIRLVGGVNYLKKFTKTSTIYMEDYQLN